jgi:prepilin-type N-terminal cleavage/methylation domain-containing protein
MRRRCQAFTLLEVIVAVLLIALISLSLQRFVDAMLTGISASSEREAEAEKISALFRYLSAQLNAIPPSGLERLKGDRHKFNNLYADELTWRCRGGAGTLTSSADGEWRVTLMLRPQKERQSKYDLGLRRVRVEGGSDKEWNWVPLLTDVPELKIDYYDADLNAPMERWTDNSRLPLLVTVTFRRASDPVPETATFKVNPAEAQRR